MKKLSLNNLKLEANDLLQRSQIKAVLGGGYGGNCTEWSYSCTDDSDCCPGLTCAIHPEESEGLCLY